MANKSTANFPNFKQKRIMNFFKDIRRNPFSYILLLPATLYVLVFSYLSYPYMIIAFREFSYRAGPFGGDWVGLKNFGFFFKTGSALTTTVNTIKLNLLFIIFSTLSAIIVSLILNELKCKKFVRTAQTAILLPHFLSWVVVGFMLYSLFSMDYGLFNSIAVSLGLEKTNWYIEADVWPWILTLMRVWKTTGYTAIIYLSAITSIDESLYESAKIDGANRFMMCLKITMPLLMPTVCIMTIMSIGRIFYGDFGMIYALVGDNGVLYPTTDVIDTYVFRALRETGDSAQAMAVSLFQSVMGCIAVIAANLFTKKYFADGALF